MDLAAVMDALAAAFPAAPATRRFAWPQESVVPPAWVVGYPDEIEFDVTFGNGAQSATFPCWYVVGRVDQKAARDALSDVIGGALAVKAAIESSALLNGGTDHVADTCRVTSCRPATLRLGAVELLSARFDVEVITR